MENGGGERGRISRPGGIERKPWPVKNKKVKKKRRKKERNRAGGVDDNETGFSRQGHRLIS